MNTNATSLDRLHDIVAPSAVPWWPPAPGWYWLMALVLTVLLGWLIKGFVRWQHNRYRREALAELARLEHALKNSNERAAALRSLGELLKRTALTAFPREEVATLTGAKWFELLDQTGSTTTFTQGFGAMLENAIYDPRTVRSLDDHKLRELLAAIRHWIKEHKPEIQQKDAKTAKTQAADKPSLPSLPSVQRS